MSVEQTVRKLGWNLESRSYLLAGELPQYRAVCPGISGGFPTPWRDSEEAALNDVLMVKSSQNAEAVGKQTPRW